MLMFLIVVVKAEGMSFCPGISLADGAVRPDARISRLDKP